MNTALVWSYHACLRCFGACIYANSKCIDFQPLNHQQCLHSTRFIAIFSLFENVVLLLSVLLHARYAVFCYLTCFYYIALKCKSYNIYMQSCFQYFYLDSPEALTCNSILTNWLTVFYCTYFWKFVTDSTCELALLEVETSACQFWKLDSVILWHHCKFSLCRWNSLQQQWGVVHTSRPSPLQTFITWP